MNLKKYNLMIMNVSSECIFWNYGNSNGNRWKDNLKKNLIENQENMI